MKKCIILLIALIAVIGMSVQVFSLTNVTRSKTLLSAQTATSTFGSEVSFGYNIDKLKCIATWGGTVPTNIVFAVHFADVTTVYDTTNTDASVTMTASPWRFYIVDKGGRFAKANYVSKSGGGADTSITLTCIGGN